MADFVFTSPGVKFRERNLTYVSRNVGVTTLGSVGETIKGPAFEPIFVQDFGQFKTRFGGLNYDKFSNEQLKYQLPYVANSYLSESSQMWVTRVLGLSGYDAGQAWALSLSAGVDYTTTGATTSVTTDTDNSNDGFYLGTRISEVGDTGTYFAGFEKSGTSTFEGDFIEFTATTVNGLDVTVDTQTTVYSGESLSEYENMVLGVIRSRATVEDVTNGEPQYNFKTQNIQISNNTTLDGTGDMFGELSISVDVITGNTVSDIETKEYLVSLNPSDRNYIVNVLGDKVKGKNTPIYVEAIYPDLIKKLDSDELGYGINGDLIDINSNRFADYKQQYQTPQTPWIISELRGSEIERLFRFITISDGTSANKEIKISIQNIDPVSQEFDIVIRDFNDTDANIIVLESYTRCSMRKELNNYIGSRIGTKDGEYELKSNYVMLEMNPNAPEDSFACGFEGYNIPNFNSTYTDTTSGIDGVIPKIFYNKSYENDDNVNRTYLGVTERAYDGTNVRGTGINQNIFNYYGATEKVKTKGFHLDSGATQVYEDGSYIIGEFETGESELRDYSDVNSPVDVYYEKNTRKFTVVPYGGFDGWNEHRTNRTYGDLYRKGGILDGVTDGMTPKTDFQAWENAINTFSNPEAVTINVFTTPGINWSENNILVKNTLRMVENQRNDSIYIIDSPDIYDELNVGTEKPDIRFSREVTELLETANIDSSYAATYFPYIQIRDNENNANVWLPPTGEIVKSIAFTDNIKFPWFAPAGLQRGVVTAIKTRYKLSQEARDILYTGRINPIAEFANTGVAIFGQKTLQTTENALDRINVRRLILELKVFISNISTRLLFEQNDDTTIDQFLTKTRPILQRVQRERGLRDFRIVMDDTNNTPETKDRNELYGEIYIKPTSSLEFLGIGFTLMPTGASFDEVI
jgi:hypothetical protein